ncbi:MAG: GTP-binding protein, partial [Proteobacteria bacterium]|nr:GTP-binding protein [Pseudomonadota bacterium]
MTGTQMHESGERLPVSVLTGFLGSGKTTVLAHLLRDPGMADTAVVINEFGEVGLDHMLVESSSDDITVLSSGCLCCTIRGDLIDTLRNLFRRRVKGEVPEFKRLVIETTGLADPAPILHTLMTDPLLAARYRLDGVITTVDGVHGLDQFDRQFETVKQAAVADRLLITKTDMAAPEGIAALKARLATINPAAAVHEIAHGTVDPALLFGAGLYNPATKSPDVARWLNEEAYAQVEAEHHHGHDHHHHDVNRHDDHIRAFCLTAEEP